MKIVKASNNEIPDIIQLNSFVQKIHCEEHPDIFKPVGNDADVSHFFNYIISQENNYLFIAYQNETAVGYAWASLENKPGFALKYGRRQAYIHQIAVHEKYRKQNIGKTLFNEIKSLAANEGIDHFELDSWAFNTDAHVFFKKMGFETYNIKMWRKPIQST
ncbi:MAG: GNAT family N-acetyltransferase [bacterium]|nr:GNAT family N-acetyltransferase [bacterium]